MNRSEEVFTYYSFVEHDGVLVVISLPWHVSHEEVASERKLTSLSSVSLREDVALLHPLSLITDRMEVDGHILVRAAELWYFVFLQSGFEAYELLVLCAVVEDADGCGINIVDDTVTFSYNHGARVLTHLLLYASAYDRSLSADERHSLSHHVRAHEGTVGVVMLEEWDKSGCDRCNLLRSDIHVVNLCWWHYRVVGILAALHDLADEVAVVSERRISLSDNLAFLLFS